MYGTKSAVSSESPVKARNHFWEGISGMCQLGIVVGCQQRVTAVGWLGYIAAGRLSGSLSEAVVYWTGDQGREGFTVTAWCL